MERCETTCCSGTGSTGGRDLRLALLSGLVAALCGCGPAVRTVEEPPTGGGVTFTVGGHAYVATSAAYAPLPGNGISIALDTGADACTSETKNDLSDARVIVVVADNSIDPNSSAYPGAGDYLALNSATLQTADPNSPRYAVIGATPPAATNPPEYPDADAGSLTISSGDVASRGPLTGSIDATGPQNLRISGPFVATWCAGM